MHPRNPYSLLPPDFAALAASSVGEELRPFVFTNASDLTSIDFKRPEAVRALTRTLLLHDFNLDINIPVDRLCPTVTSAAFFRFVVSNADGISSFDSSLQVANRLDYLLWIQDVLLASSPSGSSSSSHPLVRGLDIGTGSTAIYPLLGTRHFPGWTFCATEIDPDSHHHAQANISRNWASKKIKLVKTTKEDPIFLPFHLDPDASFDFTMCNPPFYSSEAEIAELASNKLFTPHAVCTGAETEMITPGGEVAFVKRMVEESLALGGRCRWFTSLLGKSSSVGEIVQFLREKKITNYALSDSVQGHSKRWCIAWSHQNVYLPDSLARHSSLSSTLHSFLPTHTSYSHTFPSSPLIPNILLSTFSSLGGITLTTLPSPTNPSTEILQLSAQYHSWSRAARRGKAVIPSFSEGDGPFLVAWFEVKEVEEGGKKAREAGGGEKKNGATRVEMRIVSGVGREEAVALENMVARKIGDELAASVVVGGMKDGGERGEAMDVV